MKIAKMKKLTNGKYQIKLSNRETLTTYDDVILKYNLLFDKEITSEMMAELYTETKYYDIYYKVIQYIKTRMRCTYEIQKYLKKYQILPKEEEQILTELTTKGLLNDRLFAKAYASDKFHLSNYGPDKIQKELKDLHISDELIYEAMEGISEEEVMEQLKQLLEKKMKTNHKYSKYQWKEKMMMEFLQKGYKREMIQECLELVIIDDTMSIQKEYEKQMKRLSKKYSGEQLVYQVKGKLYQKGYSSDDINRVLSD